MILWKRAAMLGFLSWLIPFAVSLAAFPLKQANAPLFSTLMDLVVLLTGGLLLARYFRNRAVSMREALLVGALWLVVNLFCDYPMFAYGPMRMTPINYYSEIGAAYLALPAFAFCAARMVKAS